MFLRVRERDGRDLGREGGKCGRMMACYNPCCFMVEIVQRFFFALFLFSFVDDAQLCAARKRIAVECGQGRRVNGDSSLTQSSWFLALAFLYAACTSCSFRLYASVWYGTQTIILITHRTAGTHRQLERTAGTFPFLNTAARDRRRGEGNDVKDAQARITVRGPLILGKSVGGRGAGEGYEIRECRMRALGGFAAGIG